MAQATRRKPAARSRKRKSTAEPKRIINRKKATRKKTAVSATKAKRVAAREKAAKVKLEQDSRDTAKVQRLSGRGKSPAEIAEATGLPISRVRKLSRTDSVNPKDKIVGTETEVAKKIVKLRNEGIPWPTIRARTGLSGVKIRELAEQAGGSSKGRPKKATAKKATTAKPAQARKAAASKTKPKAAARSKRSPKAAKASVKEDAAPTGRPQGRRARRAQLSTFLKDVVWDLDSDNDAVAEGIVGHTIEVTRDFNGRAVRATEHNVMKVNAVELHEREGRIIEFVDENHQARFVSSREITALK